MPVTVRRRANESDEQLLRRFRKQVAKSRIMSEVRRKRWHMSRSEVRRLKREKSIRRLRRRRRRIG
jgi:small subunit ribosomal protein S21